LTQQLERHEECQECLGFAGRLFVAWLGGMLRSVDPAPPPEDSYAHLVLDLYEREADELQALIARSGRGAPGDDAQWGASIREVARREIDSTLLALSMIAEPPAPSVRVAFQEHAAALGALEDAKASFRDSADALLSVRRSVSQAFRGVAPIAEAKSPPGDDGKSAPGAVIREMVEDSGGHINALAAALA